MILPSKSGDFDLTDDLIAAFELRYPFIRVKDELLKANLWLHRNAARRPVRMLVFLDKWLKRAKPAQERKLHVVGGAMSPQQIEALGRELGLSARPAESWEQYARRLAQAQDAKRRETA